MYYSKALSKHLNTTLMKVLSTKIEIGTAIPKKSSVSRGEIIESEKEKC